MRVKSQLVFHANPNYVESLFQKYKQKLTKNDTMQVVYFFIDTPEYMEFKHILEDMKIDYSEFKEVTYSKDELDKAQLLRMIPKNYCGYPQPEDEYEEVSYEMNSRCPICLQGGIQKAPFRMLKPKMGANDISGIHWVCEYVITHKLRDLIERENFLGIEFWPIIHHKSNMEIEGVCQLYITNVMPQMDPKSEIVRAPGIDACKCGKKGYYMPDSEPIYEKSTLNNIKDLNKTSEWLGGAHSTWQLPIVSNRFYEFIKKEKIKGVWFIPIGVI